MYECIAVFENNLVEVNWLMTGTEGFMLCERSRKVDTRNVQTVLENGRSLKGAL